MVSPQKENGFTAIANEILEALIAYRIPGEQMQCLLFVIRKTYGFNKKEDMIANSQFVEFTGINAQNVSRALKLLVEKKLVIKKDNTESPTYRFNKDYDTWAPLSKKITVIEKDKDCYRKRLDVLSKKTDTKEKKDKRQTPIVPLAQFDLFWQAYPRKHNKGQAFKTWGNLHKSRVLPESIDILISAIETQKKTEQWKKEGGQYIPLPSTWLNAWGWMNVVEFKKREPDLESNGLDQAWKKNFEKWQREGEG